MPLGVSAQVKKEQPIGLVVFSADAQLRRARSALPLKATSGDLLFSGDALLTGANSSATFLYCLENLSMRLNPGSEVVLDAQQVQLKRGSLSNKTHAPICLLPELERSPVGDSLFYADARTRQLKTIPQTGDLQAHIQSLPENERNALMAELQPVEKALAANPNDGAYMIAKAVLLQKYNLIADATAAYRQVSATWPESVWTRQLLHEVPESAPDAEKSKPQPNRGEGKTYALLVGISKYQRLSELQFLRYADQDALTFDQHLRSGRGGSVPAENVVLLVNEKATTAAIKNNINQFLKLRAGPNDTVLLFIAAHGIVSDT